MTWSCVVPYRDVKLDNEAEIGQGVLIEAPTALLVSPNRGLHAVTFPYRSGLKTRSRSMSVLRSIPKLLMIVRRGSGRLTKLERFGVALEPCVERGSAERPFN